MAREECANYRNDACQNLVIHDDLHITRAGPDHPCVLADNKRCPYFELLVLPLATCTPNQDKAAGFHEAAREYYGKLAHNIPKEYLKARKCPDCGAALAKRKRYCDQCSKKRRKAAKAIENPAGVNSCCQPAVNSETDPKTPMNQGCFPAF